MECRKRCRLSLLSLLLTLRPRLEGPGFDRNPRFGHHPAPQALHPTRRGPPPFGPNGPNRGAPMFPPPPMRGPPMQVPPPLPHSITNYRRETRELELTSRGPPPIPKLELPGRMPRKRSKDSGSSTPGSSKTYSRLRVQAQEISVPSSLSIDGQYSDEYKLPE